MIYDQKLTPVEISYIAAIVDWGHNFSCNYYQKKGRYGYSGSWNVSLRLRVSGKDQQLLIVLKEMLKDFSTPKLWRNKQILNVNGKDLRSASTYALTIAGKRLDALLEMIKPYVRVCNKEIDILIEFRRTYGAYYGKNGIPESIQTRRLELQEEMGKLRRRASINDLG